MFDTEKQALCEDLTEQGFACVRSKHYEDAIGIAERLRGLLYSSGFEIQALALNGMGRTEEAVSVLLEGVERAPDVWLLWQLLGNYESDLDRCESAASRYERALNCPHADSISIRLNQAVLATRTGRWDHAFSLLEEVDDPRFALAKSTIRVQALVTRKEYDRAEDEALAGLLRLADEPEIFNSEWYGRLVIASIRASLANGDERKDARDTLVQARRIDEENPTILEAIRELDARPAENAKWFRIVIDGQRRKRMPDEPMGFVVQGDVVAETTDEALELYQTYTYDAEDYILQIDECEPLGWALPAFKGLYRTSERQDYWPNNFVESKAQQ